MQVEEYKIDILLFQKAAVLNSQSLLHSGLTHQRNKF